MVNKMVVKLFENGKPKEFVFDFDDIHVDIKNQSRLKNFISYCQNYKIHFALKIKRIEENKTLEKKIKSDLELGISPNQKEIFSGKTPTELLNVDFQSVEK